MNALRRNSSARGIDEPRTTCGRRLPAPQQVAGAGGRPASPWATAWQAVIVIATLIPSGASLPGLAAETASPTAPAAASDQVPPPSSTPAFQPQELSIGEPISLPNAAPLPAGRSTPPTASPPLVASPNAAAAAIQAAGNGWLGIAVDDAIMTGRLVVVEVAADGPAAKAGVRQQDVLLAINGNQLRTADEMAAVLAAISPGQLVKVAVGRDNKVDDLVMTAATRPTDAMSRNWQSAPESTATPVPRSRQFATETPRPAPVLTPPDTRAPVDLQPAAVAGVPLRESPSTASAWAAPAPSAAVAPVFVPSPPAALDAPSPAVAVPARPSVAVLPAPATAVPPSVPRTASPAQAGGRIALGVRTVPVDPGVQSRFQLADQQGAFVIGVVEDLPAAKAGVPPGSVIVALNRQPVRSPQELTQLVTHGPVGTPVTLHYVLPGGQSRQADVVLQSLDEPLERALVGTPGMSPSIAPPTLQPAPQTARRLPPAPPPQAAAPEPLARVEEALRRMTTRLEQIDRRLEQWESAR